MISKIITNMKIYIYHENSPVSAAPNGTYRLTNVYIMQSSVNRQPTAVDERGQPVYTFEGLMDQEVPPQ